MPCGAKKASRGCGQFGVWLGNTAEMPWHGQWLGIIARGFAATRITLVYKVAGPASTHYELEKHAPEPARHPHMRLEH